MKIEINYDLIDKINEAKGKYKLKRYHKEAHNTFPIIQASITEAILPIPILLSLDYPIEKIIPTTLKAAIGIYALLFVISTLSDALARKIAGTTVEQSAKTKLHELSLKLNSQYVKTSLPLLLDSKEYHKEHKLILNKKGLPCIMEHKYIMIPTYNDGEIKEKSILQEHQVGTNKYILSLGTKVKKKEFKLAYNAGI